MAKRANPLFPRLVLVIIVLGQVTIAPIIGFSLTYLLSIKNDGDQLSFDIDLAALDWIIIAGLMYGSLSLILALIAGSYSPTSVVDRGGWFTVLGLRRNVNTPELIDRARLNLQRSPYGKMARLVSSKTDTYDLFSIHGGLQILAIPIQVALIAIPLLIMEGIPERFVEPEQAFELGMVGYFIALWFGLRIQPMYSRHLIGIAAWFRKILAKISKFSWILPIIIFWIIARVMLQLSLERLEVDYQAWHNVQLEAVLMKSIMPSDQIPDAAIIDFLVAISVLPVAVFTTISVLAGAHDMPDWMCDPEERLENLNRNLLEEDSSSSGDKDDSDLSLDELSPSNPTTNTEESEGINDKSKEDESRMIDLPFGLFDD
ncbi:MAG: hypothetical protein MKZ68_04300 [Candidatus Thalassarchaeum sp.]|nr:hypothetical protein [Candidatus Thalassarchaeum sp.]|tara:strand:- start:3570 stop:4688 length:1119 start_codon:yes stop_codon:yes gene_type:complete